MDYDGFIRTIQESVPQDWLSDDEFGICVLKKDLLISIEREEPDTHEVFAEDWATQCADPNAYVQRFFLKYGGNIIDTFYTVAIDGNRAKIPYPDTNDMTISPFQYAIASIVNKCFAGDLDGYMKRKGIKIRDKE